MVEAYQPPERDYALDRDCEIRFDGEVSKTFDGQTQLHLKPQDY